MRRSLQLARSPEVRRSVLRLCAALMLLFPVLVVAFDHHGVERLPGHAHLTMDGESVPPHFHGFEVPHSHRSGRASVSPSVVAIGMAQPAAFLSMATEQAASMPHARPIDLSFVEQGTARAIAPVLVHQTSFDPPTRPPTGRPATA